MSALTLFHNTYRSTAPNPDAVPDLVLLHGWGLHSIVWDAVMPRLLEHFQVTVVDLPGMGQSPNPKGDYTLDFVVEWVAKILLPQCHLLGWSLGGQVALKLAERFPDKILSVVGLCSNPKFVGTESWPGFPEALFVRFAEMYEEDREGTLVRFLALNCKDSPTIREDTKQLKDILYFCGLPDPRALRGGLNILREADLSGLLSSLPVPMAFLFGENDNLVPKALADHLAADFPRMPQVVMPDVSHVPFISASDKTVDALIELWQTLGALRV